MGATASTNKPLPLTQSTEVSNAPVKAGEGKPRRHFLVGEKDLVMASDPPVSTLYESFMQGLSVSGMTTKSCFQNDFESFIFN